MACGGFFFAYMLSETRRLGVCCCIARWVAIAAGGRCLFVGSRLLSTRPDIFTGTGYVLGRGRGTCVRAARWDVVHEICIERDRGWLARRGSDINGAEGSGGRRGGGSRREGGKAGRSDGRRWGGGACGRCWSEELECEGRSIYALAGQARSPGALASGGWRAEQGCERRPRARSGVLDRTQAPSGRRPFFLRPSSP